MAEKEVVETSEAQIAVHWQEEGYYYTAAGHCGRDSAAAAAVAAAVGGE